MTDERLARRRAQRRERQATQAVHQLTQPLHTLPTYELVSEEGLHKIHQASLTILGEIGIDFYDDEVLAILAEHGATVKGSTVFFDPTSIMQYVAMAPSEFTQLARNPANSVILGGNYACFAPVYGPPFVYDQARGRREATLEDFQNIVKLTYLSPYLHHSGGTVVEPTDLPDAHPPPRHGLQPHQVQRQAVHGLGHQRPECGGQRQDGRNRVWR